MFSVRFATAALLLAAPAIAAQSPATKPTLSPETREFVSVDAPIVALTHVKLIDGTGAPAVDDQTVVIQNGKVSALGKTGTVSIPKGAKVLALAGHTVYPGFVGLHDHTYYDGGGRSVQGTTSSPRLYLASGVTTIRTTGSMFPYDELNLKKSIDGGEAPGPRMFVTGPYITGSKAGARMTDVETAEEARKFVDYWADEGVTWLKFYNSISREAMGAAIEEAHKRGLKTTGHIGSVTFREAVALGIDNIEHGYLTNTDYVADKEPDKNAPVNGYDTLDMNSPAIQQTFHDMVEHHVPMTSTLAVWEDVSAPYRYQLPQRTLDALDPTIRAAILARRTGLRQRPGDSTPPAPLVRPTMGEKRLRKAMDYEIAFVKAGGLLAAGVDPTGGGGALPGFGDQRDFELLVEAGFTPEQAIQICSTNGGKVLGITDQAGAIQVGNRVDFVITKGDVVRTPSDIANTVTVFKDGVGYDSAKLVKSVNGLVGIR
jgi:imidazolonepropionase-like amidohydrolase